MVDVAEVAEVEGILFGVAVESQLGADEAIDIVFLEEVAGSEHVSAGDLVGIGLLDNHGNVGLRVVDSIVDGLLNVGCELAEVEGLTGTDVEFGEPGEQGALRRVGWAELKEKVDDGKDVWPGDGDVGRFGPVDRRC